MQDWFEAKGKTFFGGDASQHVEDIIGYNVDSDSESEDLEDGGSAVAHATGGSVKHGDAVTPNAEECAEGVEKLEDPTSDPLFFAKLAEARGMVLYIMIPSCRSSKSI